MTDLDDLAQRLTKAAGSLEALAMDAAENDRAHLSSAHARLRGKAEGVRVALSYVNEMIRERSADISAVHRAIADLRVALSAVRLPGPQCRPGTEPTAADACRLVLESMERHVREIEVFVGPATDSHQTATAPALAEVARHLALHDAAALMAAGFPEVADDECAGPPPTTPADLAEVGICPGCRFPLHQRDAECGWHEGAAG